jgi:hypothetical protein
MFAAGLFLGAFLSLCAVVERDRFVRESVIALPQQTEE